MSLYVPFDKEQDDIWFYKTSFVEYKFAFIPKRCALTGKRIWLKRGYKFTKMITGPGDPVYLYRWHNSKEHILWLLKGNK